GPLGFLSDLAKKNFDKAGQRMLNMSPSSIQEARKHFLKLKDGKKAFNGAIASALGRSMSGVAEQRAAGQAVKFLTPKNQSFIRSAMNNTEAKQVIDVLKTLDKATKAQASMKPLLSKSGSAVSA